MNHDLFAFFLMKSFFEALNKNPYHLKAPLVTNQVQFNSPLISVWIMSLDKI